MSFKIKDALIKNIDSTNNRAERGLRHAVVIRKISNGSRENFAKLLKVLKENSKNKFFDTFNFDKLKSLKERNLAV